MGMPTRSRPQDGFVADRLGQGLQLGDQAVLCYVDRLFLYGLTVEHQEIYEAQLEKPVRIADFDDCGQVAIAFADAAGAEQLFWVEPRWLRRQAL
jgi:hypothetical protein